jgi:imidazolonepropionase-like amidohydrolase
MRIDLLIKNGHVVDPHNGINKITDVALADGKVAEVADGIALSDASEVIDATGLLVTPGLIDPHVHVVPEGAGGISFNMLLRKGVTSALDMAGPVDVFVTECRDNGHGINAGSLQALSPGSYIRGADADRAEIAEAIDRALADGAFGIKILGGHYPFTPETTGRIIEEAAKRKVYIAFHAGSTANGSNIDGFEEALRLAAGNPLHMAHANAYCRGQVEDPLTEVKRLLDALDANPNIVSEAYLSIMNGTSAFIDPATGKAKSGVTRTWLERKGYASDKAGTARAIGEGWCLIYGRVGSEMRYLSPEDGLKYWEDADTNAWCSFPVNNPVAMLACLTHRRADGSFTVNAISTDGGFVPRNVMMDNGIRLAQMRYIEMDDMVAKCTCSPARMLGLLNKGHLSAGADADVAIFYPQCGTAKYTIIGGQVRMASGVCSSGPGTLFTSAQGEKTVKAAGANYFVPDIARSDFMKGHAK